MATRGILEGLRHELDGRAAVLPGVARSTTTDAVEYRVGSTVVCVVAHDGIAFRIGDQVAQAALRTPDVTVSPRGIDWVRLAPQAIDRLAIDRATAWFDLAVRLAGTAA